MLFRSVSLNFKSCREFGRCLVNRFPPLVRAYGRATGFAYRHGLLPHALPLDADEVFLTGTAAEVIGVTKIGDQPVGDGTVGPMTRRLVAEFKRRVAADAPED